MKDVFEKSSKLKFRFKLNNGVVATEDLWDLKLVALDTLAKKLNKEVKEANEESFIEERSSENIEIETKLEVVKYIIRCKLDDMKKAEDRVLKLAKKANILQAISNKQNSSLNEMSIDDLKNELDGLD